MLNTPAIYGVGAGTDTVSIAAPSFTWSGVATQQFTALNSLTGVTTTALPGGQIAGGLLPANGIGHLDINAGTIVLGYGPQAQPNDQVLLQRFVAGFGNVALNATRQITANNQSGLTVFQNGLALSQTASGLGATGALGNLTLNAPLITTQSAAVLDLTAGGTLKLVSPGPVASTSVVSLGGQIDAIAGTVDIGTAIALRAGQFNVTAQNGIDVAGTAAIDLSGRPVTFSDQTRFAPAGTLAFESTAGSITLETGSRIDVSATGASAGSVAFSALAGGVALDGTLVGAANPGQTGGSFTVIAGTLATTTQVGKCGGGRQRVRQHQCGPERRRLHRRAQLRAGHRCRTAGRHTDRQPRHRQRHRRRAAGRRANRAGDGRPRRDRCDRHDRRLRHRAGRDLAAGADRSDAGRHRSARRACDADRGRLLWQPDRRRQPRTCDAGGHHPAR